MTSRLEVICQRYEQITEMLSDMAIISDIKKLTELSKEQRSIEKIVFKYREVQQIEKDIADLKGEVFEQKAWKEISKAQKEATKTEVEEQK